MESILSNYLKRFCGKRVAVVGLGISKDVYKRQRLHMQPINLVVFKGPYQLMLWDILS